MKRRALIVLLVVGCSAATGAKVAWNSLHANEDDSSQVFSRSLSEARRSGILVSPLLADTTPGGEKDAPRLAVAEAWIEQCAVHRYSLVWLHRRVPAEGFTVVIRLARPVSPALVLWPPERSASFGSVGGMYFVKHFERAPEFPMPVSVAEGKAQLELVTLKAPATARASTHRPASGGQL